jgi:hypothetical protein
MKGFFERCAAGGVRVLAACLLVFALVGASALASGPHHRRTTPARGGHHKRGAHHKRSAHHKRHRHHRPSRLGTGVDSVPSVTYLDTMSSGGFCLGIRLGGSIFPTGAGGSCGPTTTPHVLVLDDETLACSTLTGNGQCASLFELPTGSGASARLKQILDGYLHDGTAHLVILTGPAGSVAGDPVLPNGGFSYVFPLKDGLQDLTDSALGNKNLGMSLADSASSAPSKPGELRGWLQANVGPSATISHSFVSSDHPAFETQASVDTRVPTAPSAPADRAVYALVTASGKALEAPNASTTPGTNLRGGGETDLPAQRWQLRADPEAPEWFQVVDVNSRLCLDVTGASKQDGAPVAQWPCDSAGEQSNQLWRPVSQGNGSYVLVNQNSGLSLTLNGNETGNPAVQQHSNPDDRDQHWQLRPMTGTAAAGGAYVLASALGPAIDLVGGAQTPGTPGTKVAGAAEADGASEQWVAVPTGNPVAHPGTLALVNEKTGLCLSAPAGDTHPEQLDCGPSYDDGSQLWLANRQADGSYTIVNAGNHLALTLNAGTLGARRPRSRQHHRPQPPRRSRRPHKPQAHHRRPHRGKPRRGLGAIAASTTIWYSSARKDIADTGFNFGEETYRCGDYAQSGKANLYPYLVQDGSSYAYQNISVKDGKSTNDVNVNARIDRSDQLAGRLVVDWRGVFTSGDYALQIKFECTSEAPFFSVTSNGTEKVGSTTATIGAQLGKTGGDYDFRVEYGTSEADYTSRSAVVHARFDTSDQHHVQIPLERLQPSTTYHYRVAAVSDGVTSYSGADQTFTTNAYGMAIVQTPENGAPSQRWFFRPLDKAVTMRIAGSEYTTRMPLSWSGFAMLALDPALRQIVGPTAYYTGTGNGVQDARQQDDLTHAIEFARNRPGSMVFLQSINQPRPTTVKWNDLAREVAALGGTPVILNGLDGTGDYALVGCNGCKDAPEARGSSAEPDRDHLEGILQRDPTSGYIPSFSDPGALSHPAVDYQLLPLAYAPPTPWPIPAGVTPLANTEVLRDMAKGLKLTTESCHSYPAGQPDLRSAYCNLGEDWHAKRETLVGSSSLGINPLFPPGQTQLDCSSKAPIANLGYSGSDWCAVAREVAGELTDLSQVKTEVDNFKSLFASTNSLVNQAITDDAKDLADRIGIRSDSEAKGSIVEFAAAAIGVAGEVFPESGGPLFGALSEALSAGASASSLGGVPNAAEFHAGVDDFAHQATARIIDASQRFGLIFDLLAQDRHKLATAAGYADGPWSTNNIGDQQFQRALTNGVKAQMYRDLIPAYYHRFSINATPQNWRTFTCGVTGPHGETVPDRILGGEPDSAAFAPVLAIANDGSPSHDKIWFLAAGAYPKFTNTPPLHLPQASLTDNMFKPIKAGGIGLDKAEFFAKAGLPENNDQPGNCRT